MGGNIKHCMMQDLTEVMSFLPIRGRGVDFIGKEKNVILTCSEFFKNWSVKSHLG